MSVPEGRRGLSDMEFYRTAIRLRRDITFWLLRDFGVKDKTRDVKILSKTCKMEAQDAEKLKEILERYGVEKSIKESYPEWLIDTFRESIMDILRELVLNIRAANSIYPGNQYPANMREYELRRTYQDKAIGNCDQLYEELQYVGSVIPVDAQKYMPYIEKVEREIALLKGWRKSDNKIYKRIISEARKEGLLPPAPEKPKGKEKTGKKEKA